MHLVLETFKIMFSFIGGDMHSNYNLLVIFLGCNKNHSLKNRWIFGKALNCLVALHCLEKFRHICQLGQLHNFNQCAQLWSLFICVCILFTKEMNTTFDNSICIIVICHISWKKSRTNINKKPIHIA